MTNEERTNLIEHLKYNRSIGADYTLTNKDADEIIKALEQQDILDNIRAEIEQLPSELTADGRRMIRRGNVFRVFYKYRAESEEEK